MATAISANKAELLAIANSVASEKMIDKAIVIEAMEEAIQKAARSRYGAENDIRAKLDPVSGDLRLWRVVEVVEEVEDYFKQVNLEQAQKLQDGAALGDFIVDPLPPVDLGRIDAQSAKQVIFQKVRDAERERQYEEFKDRAGEVITGVIKSVEFGHVIVNLGRAEGVIRRDQQIPREAARVGERIRALISKGVDADSQGSVLGVNASLGSLARAIAPWLASALYGVTRATPFFVAAGVMVLALLVAGPATARASRTQEPSA